MRRECNTMLLIHSFPQLLIRWFGKLLLEGAVFSGSTGSTTGVSADALTKIRVVLNKENRKNGSASALTKMTPIPKVTTAFVAPSLLSYHSILNDISESC